MNKRILRRIGTALLVVVILACTLSFDILGAGVNYDYSNGGSNYYNVLSKKAWDISPGVSETEFVLNNDAATRRQVVHTLAIDTNNPYVKVIPGYKGMWPKAGNYGTESTLAQALNAEKLGYGNVVAATNCSLSWYNEAYYKQNPHLIGEPLGYSVLDGKYYSNSRGHGAGVKTCIVINYDKHPLTGEDRPDDMPKVWIRKASEALTGWEEQAIPVLFDYLVKPDANGNPVSCSPKEDHGSGIASRTFVGVKADGTLIITVVDGEQAPYSVGFTTNEMADYMIKMGCVVAANCDGGGSTTFCSQRPGEDLKVNCSLADGGERPTTNTILVISTAPADGVFARAAISSEYDYYTPGSTIEFDALGTDAVGTKVEIPSDAEWKIKEDGMGTIKNGVFTSNGTEGTVTAQLVYDGKVAGEHSINIAVPDAISFEQPVVTIPFGKTAKIPVKATIDGMYEIGLGANDVTFTTTNSALGSFDGLNFVAVDEGNAPTDITSVVTATLNLGSKPVATAQLNLGRASQILWDFENGQSDIDEWNVINNRKNAAHWDYELDLSLADRTNGKVHDGDYSMRLVTNGLSSKDSHSEQYAWIRLGVEGAPVVLENARSVGFWLYVPEDNIQCWVQGHYKTDSNGDGVFDTDNLVSMMESENVYYNIDESGWHYLSMDISAFDKIALQADKQYDKDPSDGMVGEKGEFFLALVFHKAINNKLWQENGSINGKYTYYLDNFTVDYSDAVEDRENPVFDKIFLDGTTALVKRDVITTNKNILNLSAAVKDKDFKLDTNKNEVPVYNASGLDAETAKVYIDGVEVKSAFANGVLSADNIRVADGYHRVKFEICDKVGNKSVVIRVIKVESGEDASTLALVPADKTLDRIPFGSIYWMNLEANKIETIKSVSAVIDLNNVNHWQLDHMELAEGFTAEYTIDEETNTATITITRTGDSDKTGAATLAKLPVRILYFDTDIRTPGYTAQTYWTSYSFWAQDMKMDVDKGLITFVDSSTGTFSNEEFHVDTEMYTSMANMDKEYFAAHGTTHVHTPVAIENKAATCSENGYSDRTFCEGCNSVVEWGTTVPATGHSFKPSGDKLLCACGKESKESGLLTIDGKGYYAVNGKLMSGWLTIDDEWYYFDSNNYSSVVTLNNGYVTFEFEADGKVKSGQWYHSSKGSRYYYGLGYYQGNINGYKWVEIDGKKYCFDHKGYCLKGINYSVDDYADLYEWHDFGDDGASKGKLDYTGIMHHNGNIYYLVDGCSRAGMFHADGAYYHANFENHYAAIRNTERNCYYKNNYGLLPVGTYRFGHDGKMVDKNVYNLNGVLYYYETGKISKGNGSFVYNGNNYKIESNGKVLYTGVLFDASGKTAYYVNGVESVKNGLIVDEDNEIRFYIDGVATEKGLIRDENGDYYYIDASLKAVKNATCTISADKTNNLLPAGEYKFDATGKMIDAPNVECETHRWNDWKVTTEATVISSGVETRTCRFCDAFETREIPRLECAHKWGAWIDTKPATASEVGIKERACKLCGEKETEEIPTISETKNGVVKDSDGNIRYYVNGVATRAGLVMDGQGDYYYINSSLKAVKNCSYTFSKAMSNGLLPAGTYKFDEEGKLINPPVDKCDVHFWGEWVVTTPATVTETGEETKNCYYCSATETREIPKLEIPDDCEHLWGCWIDTTPATTSDAGVKTKACKLCGKKETQEIPVISEPKNGLIKDSDGNIRYYVNGTATRAGLVQDGQGNYYYINSTLKAVKNCSYAFSKAMSNGLLPAGTYKFDKEGKLINPPDDKCKVHFLGEWIVTTPATETTNGVETATCYYCGETETREIPKLEKPDVKNGLVKDSDGNIRYYVNGVATRAGLVQDDEGNYYYINSTLKAVKNCTYAFSTAMSNGLLPGGTYQFDSEGKLILK